jgi:cobalt-zinc-cadmium resistance protein CzcA
VEAYPDVANNCVQVITQWLGISAEQVEQQVTIPLEIVMNGIPHQRLRSVPLFGFSSLMFIFDDESEDKRTGAPLAISGIPCSRIVFPGG